MGIFEKYLSVWVALAIIVGDVIGLLFDGFKVTTFAHKGTQAKLIKMHLLFQLII